MLSRPGVALASVLLAVAPAHAERVVALAPLSMLGSEDTSASTKKLAAQLEAAVASLPQTKVVSLAQVAQAIQRAKKPHLKVCERDAACLAELGKLVGASIVIDGEVGGLGEAKVVYLGATDVGTARELRSTTLSLGLKVDAAGGATGAAVRLLDPDRYQGVLRFRIDVSGATVFVNGSKVSLPATSEIALPVGTQAVRVTHPEYRDFVRFIDVGYDKTTEVPVAMTQFPVIHHDLEGKPITTDRLEYVETPVWRRWYVVAPAAVGLAILTGVIVGNLVQDFPRADACRDVDGASC